MRLVVVYTHGDGCTYWATDTRAVEYDSEEAFAVDLEEAWLKCKRKRADYEFEFAGKTWSLSNLSDEKGKYVMPCIYTLEDWFSQTVADKHG